MEGYLNRKLEIDNINCEYCGHCDLYHEDDIHILISDKKRYNSADRNPHRYYRVICKGGCGKYIEITNLVNPPIVRERLSANIDIYYIICNRCINVISAKNGVICLCQPFCFIPYLYNPYEYLSYKCKCENRINITYGLYPIIDKYLETALI